LLLTTRKFLPIAQVLYSGGVICLHLYRYRFYKSKDAPTWTDFYARFWTWILEELQCLLVKMY